MTVPVEEILEWTAKLIEFGIVTVAPAVEQAIADWKNGAVTAEEADAVAEGKFSAMMVALADPEAESFALGAQTERRLREKFNVPEPEPEPAATRLGDKEETERRTIPLADLAAANDKDPPK